jgi:hypothetical protein
MGLGEKKETWGLGEKKDFGAEVFTPRPLRDRRALCVKPRIPNQRIDESRIN